MSETQTKNKKKVTSKLESSISSVSNKLTSSSKELFIGKRKSSVARVSIVSGTGACTVNSRSFNDFFGSRFTYFYRITKPFEALSLDSSSFDINISVTGGGLTGAIDSILLAISRALASLYPSKATILRDAKLLTRDPRVVESKKYGKRKARKKEQYSKR